MAITLYGVFASPVDEDGRYVVAEGVMDNGRMVVPAPLDDAALVGKTYRRRHFAEAYAAKLNDGTLSPPTPKTTQVAAPASPRHMTPEGVAYALKREADDLFGVIVNDTRVGWLKGEPGKWMAFRDNGQPKGKFVIAGKRIKRVAADVVAASA